MLCFESTSYRVLHFLINIEFSLFFKEAFRITVTDKNKPCKLFVHAIISLKASGDYVCKGFYNLLPECKFK